MQEQIGTILCCMCGVSIQANPSNMCMNCLKTQVDITEGISKQITVFWCRGCGRYQRTTQWIEAELESRELLAFCLKKIKGLGKEVKLTDANFVWTEPHSRRLKVKLTVQKEVFNGAIMQQTFVVEFVVANMQCPDCARSYTDHTWQTVIQIRQPRIKHKRTFLFLEQLLIKHNAAERALTIREQPEGMDFFYLQQNQARPLVQFMQANFACRVKDSKKLITQDDHNNTKKYKYTTLIELVPLSKNDLVVLSPKVAATYGGVNPLMLVYKVSNTVHLIDPVSLQIIEMSGQVFWRDPFWPIMGADQLIQFCVLDTELGETGNINNKKRIHMNSKVTTAQVTVARDSDLGSNDTQFESNTHLGHLLHPGDNAMGYDIANANLTEHTMGRKGKGAHFPDIVLVKKSYPKKHRARKRKWALRSLPKEAPDRPLRKMELVQQEQEYEEFLQAIEEDPELRENVNLYKKDPGTDYLETKSTMEDDDDELPEITDLLDNLEVKVDHEGHEDDDDDDEAPIDFIGAHTAPS